MLSSAQGGCYDLLFLFLAFFFFLECGTEYVKAGTYPNCSGHYHGKKTTTLAHFIDLR